VDECITQESESWWWGEANTNWSFWWNIASRLWYSGIMEDPQRKLQFLVSRSSRRSHDGRARVLVEVPGGKVHDDCDIWVVLWINFYVFSRKASSEHGIVWQGDEKGRRSRSHPYINLLTQNDHLISWSDGIKDLPWGVGQLRAVFSLHTDTRKCVFGNNCSRDTRCPDFLKVLPVCVVFLLF
jgi:hypothetical protein